MLFRSVRGRGQALGPEVEGGTRLWSEAPIAQRAGPRGDQAQDWVVWGPGGGVRQGLALGAGPGGWKRPQRGDGGKLMESVWGTGPSRAAGAPASKRAKDESKSRSRRRWRKGKTKGERAGTGCRTEGTLDLLRGNWGLSGLTHCPKKWGSPWAGPLPPCEGVRG